MKPAPLSGNDGTAVVSECHKLLVEHEITDFDVEIRKSIVTRLWFQVQLFLFHFFRSSLSVLTLALILPEHSCPRPCLHHFLVGSSNMSLYV